jgi:hypothetical protein
VWHDFIICLLRWALIVATKLNDIASIGQRFPDWHASSCLQGLIAATEG